MLSALACGFTSAAADSGSAAPRLEVAPRELRLEGPRDAHSLIARLVEPDGVTRDVTDAVQIELHHPALAAVNGNAIAPLADGQTLISIRIEGQQIDVPVTISNASATQPIGFRRDVMPVLSKAGCNSGSCHGSARGQDGFHLSLFGYDPEGDYHALTRELPGRRVNLALPADSLVLLKATGAVPHTGGQRFPADSRHYHVLREWLAAGAAIEPADAPRVTGLEVYPQDIVLAGPDATQRLVVRATYSDGTDRDVTPLAVFISSNELSAAASAIGVVTAGQPGEALIMARFDAFTVGTQVIVVPPGGSATPRPAAAVEAATGDSSAVGNYIDELIHDKLRKLRIEPSEVCDDATFLRRAHVDIIGLLPTVEQCERFAADTSANKRDQLVEELLARKEFIEIWVMKSAERLQLRSTQEVSYKATLLYYNWLQERIAGGQPFNQIVRELIAAEGGTFTSPATNFYQLERDTLKLTENVAQALLGARIQCAQCHNHPFDRWTMNDYYGFAAFFAQIGRKQGEDPRETVVFNSGSGEMKHPLDGRVMPPKFLGGPEPDVHSRDRRDVLAEWLTSGQNRMFARNVANFVWAHFFGQGIVEPVDDARVSNPPANDALLDALADKLIEYDFDFRRLAHDICLSRAYQRSTRPNASNAGDSRNFSRQTVRRIRAETLLDCISQVTRTKDKFQGLPLGSRAVQIADGNVSSYFLTTFGRARRETVCTCEVVMEPSLSQALHLINGETVHRKIREGGVVRDLLEAGRSPEQIVEQLYLACLSRRPTAEESQRLAALLAESEDVATALEDLLWAILNSKEFLFNH